MEYESTPFFPPPITTLWHVYMLVKYIRWKVCGCFSFPSYLVLKFYFSVVNEIQTQLMRIRICSIFR